MVTNIGLLITMNKFSLLLLFSCFLTIKSFAQHTLTGKVISSDASVYMDFCTVALNDGVYTTNTDSTGFFRFENLPEASYTI